MKFADLGLAPKVLKAVEETGYETPTPIQAQAIPFALQGRDVLGIAQTGTGKTASFTLPMITLLSRGRARARMPRSLILAPTRELAAQVSENFDAYGKYLGLTKALLIGGVSFKDQDKLIDRGVDVLIATPGRLLDHFERGKLMLTGIEIMVVDEADRMLDMGFIEDLERIFKLTPFTRQTLFFSATMPPEITRLTQEFLSNPERVEVARASSTVDTIEQRLVSIPGGRGERVDRAKVKALQEIIAQERETLTNAIIFCNRKRDVSTLYRSLTKLGFNCGALHGDLDQSVRTQVLNGFRADAIEILVASDVAARGLDIPSVSHVFNYDVPVNAEDYVHRIGRTGRAGRTGVAYTFSSPNDAKLLAKVEELIKKPIPPVELPGVTDAAADDGVDAAEATADEGQDERGRNRRRRGPRRDSEAAEANGEGALETAEAQPARRRRRRNNDEREDDTSVETHTDYEEALGEAEADARAAKLDDVKGRDGARRGRGRGRDADKGGRGRRSGRGDRERRDGGAPVIGMGDHVPAFLMREVVLPRRKKSPAAAEVGSSPADEASLENEEALVRDQTEANAPPNESDAGDQAANAA